MSIPETGPSPMVFSSIALPPTTPPRTPPRTQFGNQRPYEHFSPGPPPGLTHLIPYGDQKDIKPIVDIEHDDNIENIKERLKSEPLTTLYKSEKGKIDDINEMINLYSFPDILIPYTATDTDIKIIHEATKENFKDKATRLKNQGCRLTNAYTVDEETNTGYKLFITKYGQKTDVCRNTFINELVLQKYASLINHHTMNKLPEEHHNVIVTVRVPEITGYGKVVVTQPQISYEEQGNKFVEVVKSEELEVYYIKMEHFIKTEYGHANEVFERGSSAFDSVSHGDGNVDAAINQLAEKLGLLHNDERMRNILKGNNEVVVIDFGESTVTQPSGVGTFPLGVGLDGKPRNRREHKKRTRREDTRRKTKTTRRGGTMRKTKTTRRGGTMRKTKTQRRKRKSNKKK
jgi:hypothetical protein